MTKYEAHPIAARYPLLDGDDFAAFKDSVKANGQRVAIVLFQGKILDGRNRYRACEELGIVPKTEVFQGTEAEAVVLADVLNLDRRHLTREQKRAVIAYKLKVDPARSDRSIAGEVKVSHRTVAAVREKEKPSGGQLAHLGDRAVKGKDNKTYPVKHAEARRGKNVIPAIQPAAKTPSPTAKVEEVPAYRQVVDPATVKVTKPQLMDKDLTGMARAKLIKTLVTVKETTDRIQQGIDGLRSEKIDPHTLPEFFRAIGELFGAVSADFRELADTPLEDLSTAVLFKLSGKVFDSIRDDAPNANLGASLSMLRKVFANRGTRPK